MEKNFFVEALIHYGTKLAYKKRKYILYFPEARSLFLAAPNEGQSLALKTGLDVAKNHP